TNTPAGTRSIRRSVSYELGKFGTDKRAATRPAMRTLFRHPRWVDESWISALQIGSVSFLSGSVSSRPTLLDSPHKRHRLVFIDRRRAEDVEQHAVEGGAHFRERVSKEIVHDHQEIAFFHTAAELGLRPEHAGRGAAQHFAFVDPLRLFHIDGFSCRHV